MSMKRVTHHGIRVACLALMASASGCAMEQDEPGLAEVASEVTLNSSTIEAMCEGYTSGGGQRVRGRAVIKSLSLGGGQYRHTVEVEASNWKKNIGWNTKRTSALRIVGSVYLSTLGGGETFDVDADTGGELETRIGGEVALIHSVNFQAEAQVSLTFYGRDGTSCTM